MMSRKSAWRGALALMALASVASAMGQAAGDFPNLKGFNPRAGHNGNPNGTGPGLTIGHWSDPVVTYNPLTRVRKPTAIQVDNTDTLNTLVDFPGQGPFDPTENGSFVASPFYTPLAASDPATKWAWPSIEDEAAFPFLLRIRNFPVTIGPDTYAPNSDYRFPAYLYTRATPSDNVGDDRVGKNPADVRTITYTLNGDAGVQRNYAVYAWIPVGPTRVGANFLFPQRYFVVEVQYGDPTLNIKYTETIDTYASGGGWVRIGDGGAPTTRVFPCDGINPITVRIYNTVSRNSKGEFTMPMLDISGPGGVPDGRITEQYDADSLKRFLTYADAVKAVPTEGFYEATPISARLDPNIASSQLLFDARNTLTVSNSPSDQRTVTKGVVSARRYDITTKKWVTVWRYSPAEELIDTNTILDNTVANRTPEFTPDTIIKRYQGTDSLTADITNTITGTVTYSPNLVDGTYEIYVYLPGDNNTVQFGTAVQYQVICEGTTYTFAVDQSLPRGWVRLGNRRFLSDVSGTGTGPIQVVVTNQSGVATDLTKKAYADSIRFVGEKNQAISSTPIYATARITKNGGAVVDTKIVVVADEDGRLHCLDATGNGDGTTTEYWAYPSAKDPDPNQVDGEDGVGGIAEMPLGFELSSGLVQRVGGEDYLYIGSRNGRVYCINMTGRGDYTTTQAGTTTRRWTYPSTYPDEDAITESALGSFRGSILYGVSTGGPTIYVPTTQGRIYALDPRGNAAKKSTTVKWAFPQLNQPTLGPIWMTPSYFRTIANDETTARILFGTLRKNDDPGKFYSLNAGTGVPIWTLDPGGQSDYLASPAVVNYKTLQNNNAAPNGGVIYTVNQNRITYAIDVDTGAIIWQTGELGAGARASLMFMRMTAFNNLGILESVPAIVIPTLDGRWYGMYAENRVNKLGTKRIFEHFAEGDSITASTSNATGWMFGADSLGYLYAWANTAGDTSGNQIFPGQETIVENNPAGDLFRKAKLKLVTKEAYQRLRYPTGDAQQLTRAQSLSNAFSFNRTPLAFEWGETVYVMVYDFPFKTQSPNGNPVPPPIVNVSFNVEGKTVRGVAVEARKYNPASLEPKLSEIQPDLGLPPPPQGDERVDGYAILAFPFQGGGANALPPGDAEITFTISTQALNNNGAQQNVALRPDLSRQLMKMANPIAISMVPNPSSASLLALGYDVNPSGVERLFNGNPAAPEAKNRIATTTGWAQHGQTKGATMYVYDTSMMALLRPDGMGLEGVRVTRQDLERQGGAPAVWKPLNQTLYPGFEDLPLNFPNTSIDYPDIARESIRVTKDPSGEAENPLFNGVQLKAPLIKDGSTTRQMQEGDKPEDRVFVPTPIQIDVDVPLYQPPVNPAGFVPFTNSDNSNYVQGYMGRMNVFVDSFQNGLLDVTQREAYRSFNLATAVAADEKLAVTTPSVDLGSLATGSGFSALTSPGTGFNPAAPNINTRVFQPWGGNYSTQFKEINVENRGNVNMLNLRVAKADATGGSTNPWLFVATTSDPLAWLEGGWATSNLYNGNIWSDLDWQFSPWPTTANADRNVVLQKPRVADRIPTTLTVNPRRRANANIGARESSLFNTNRFPTRNPRVAVTVPLGTPSGRYTQRMRVIEEFNPASPDILPTWNRLTPTEVETYSDPTFDILFNVRESRLTNSFTPGADSMVDPNLMIDPTTGLPSTYATTTAYSNQMPAAVRDAFGSLMVAWASNRPNWIVDPTVSAVTSNPFRLYIATLDSGWTFTNNGMSGPSGQTPISPLRDLLNWNPANGQRWWKREIANYPPTAPDQLFGSQTGETIIPSTVQYLNPSFPQAGMRGAFDPSVIYQGMYMGFVGEAQKSTQTGRISESRIMIAIVTPSANGGLSITAPGVLPGDPQMAKGKPSIIQTGTGAMIFFAGTAGGQSRIYYSRLQGANFTGVAQLPFGNGFDSVSNPSAAGRQYTGFATTDNGASIVDLTFAGRLRGRPNTEVFLGRLKAVNAGGGSGANADRLVETATGIDQNNAFVWLPYQQGERMAPETSGSYRARGAVWNLNRRLYLIQTLNGQALNVLNDGWSDPNNTPFNPNDDVYNAASDTRAYDASTGLLSYNTRLGGKAYLDPNLGSVRFSGSLPPRGAELQFSYQPRFLRVNPAGAVGYASPTGLFDGRLVSDLSFWRTQSGGTPGTNDNITNDRYLFTYNRAAAGAGQAARPYLTTLRLGVRLPYRIATNAAGAAVMTVTGNTGPYQLDPSQGRIYFTARDEDRLINVTYTGINEAGVLVPGIILQNVPVTFVGERAEEPILIEQAVNESGLTPFLDPFTWLNDRRPPLTWLFWTSTRSGSPDIYFETLAPQWAPVPVGR